MGKNVEVKWTVYIHTHIYIYICVCIYTDISTYVYIYIHLSLFGIWLMGPPIMEPCTKNGGDRRQRDRAGKNRMNISKNRLQP